MIHKASKKRYIETIRRADDIGKLQKLKLVKWKNWKREKFNYVNLELLFKFLCMIWFGSDKVKSKVENRNMVLLSKKVLVEFFPSTMMKN